MKSKKMNKTLIITLMFAFLLLFIISPFATLASLMLLLLGAAFFSVLWNIFQAVIGSSDIDSNSSN
ncbi:MAG: hypothetical protein ACREPR_13910 [Brasilonema sp.]